MLAVLLLVCGADPVPTFEVTNRMPAFTVTNHIPAPVQCAEPPAQPRYEVFDYWTFDRSGHLVKRRAVREALPLSSVR